MGMQFCHAALSGGLTRNRLNCDGLAPAASKKTSICTIMLMSGVMRNKKHMQQDVSHCADPESFGLKVTNG
jgi:hypothetical protein